MGNIILSFKDYVFIPFIADILIWLMFFGLAFLWLIDGKIKKEQALHAFLSTVIAWTISEMIKSIIPTLRPYQFNGNPPLTIATPIDGAFPSSHTAISFGMAVAAWLHDKKIGVLFLVTAAVIALGRVVSNVHSYLDICSGMIIGSLVAYFLQKLHVTKLLNK